MVSRGPRAGITAHVRGRAPRNQPILVPFGMQNFGRSDKKPNLSEERGKCINQIMFGECFWLQAGICAILDHEFYVVHSHVGPTVRWGAPGQCLSCNLRLQYLEETTTADIDKATVYITCFQPGVGIDEADLGVFIKYTTLVITIEHHIPESQD